MGKPVRKYLFYLFIIVLLLIWLLPMLFIILTALKSRQEFLHNSVFSFPKVIRWQNFPDAWTMGNLSTYMKNGIIISCIKVPLGILIESVTAFALTRLNLKRSQLFFLIILAGMMIPYQVIIVPLNIGLTQLGLVNTYAGIVLAYLGTGLPFGVMVMRGFFRCIPKELDESALIDGCGTLRLFASILMPVARPAVATLVILEMLSVWNEFFLNSIIMTDDKMRTVPAGMLRFFGEHGTQYTQLSAAVFISIVPILAVYLVFQRYFVEGISGAVKG